MNRPLSLLAAAAMLPFAASLAISSPVQNGKGNSDKHADKKDKKQNKKQDRRSQDWQRQTAQRRTQNERVNVISGNGRTVRIQRDVGDVEIRGSDNRVYLVNPDRIVIRGNNNTIYYVGSRPSVSDLGDGNELVRSRGVSDWGDRNDRDDRDDWNDGGNWSGNTRTLSLTIDNGRFNPSTLRARPNETVRFRLRNSDDVDHAVAIGFGERRYTMRGVLDPRESGVLQFRTPTPGRYTFWCPVHGDERGTLLVQ